MRSMRAPSVSVSELTDSCSFAFVRSACSNSTLRWASDAASARHFALQRFDALAAGRRDPRRDRERCAVCARQLLLQRRDLRLSTPHLAIEPEKLLVENIAAAFERLQRLEIARGARFEITDVASCGGQLAGRARRAAQPLRNHGAPRGERPNRAHSTVACKIRCTRLLCCQLGARSAQLGSSELRSALFARAHAQRGGALLQRHSVRQLARMLRRQRARRARSRARVRAR